MAPVSQIAHQEQKATHSIEQAKPEKRMTLLNE
jgi:hypothetical protein